jgi:hypothetical protein
VFVRLDHIARVSINANERNFADKSASRRTTAQRMAGEDELRDLIAAVRA